MTPIDIRELCFTGGRPVNALNGVDIQMAEERDPEGSCAFCRRAERG